ncbi:hypothetical protein ASC59_01220 [Leifsonia sp. Root1293]|nr:hypothetical protein ASC59_01220 [Leifsonia sp. Root1293]KRA10798.1 hypothetical protein ASD61_01220 [Leifsonia sp. Root60]
MIKADAGQDFLALLPRLTGYQPHNSVVLVAFRGKRTCGAIRFDLPQPAPLAVLRRFATSMIGMLCKIPEVDALVPVAYTDESFGMTDAVPQALFMDVLVHRAEISGFHVRDSLCVAADGWASYLDPDVPAGGHPLAAITESPVNRLADAEGMDVHADVRGDITLPAVDLARSERVGMRLRRLRDDPGSAAPVAAGAYELADLALPEFLEYLLAHTPDSLSPEIIAAVLWVLERPVFRDVAIIQWAFGRVAGLQALDDQVRSALDAAAEETATGLLLWGDGPRPDPERVDAAIALLRVLAASAPRSARVAPLTMLAWLSWALGQSSRASVFVAAALEIDRDYGLASLVGAMIDGGRLPEWAFEVPIVDESTLRYATRSRVT